MFFDRVNGKCQLILIICGILPLLCCSCQFHSTSNSQDEAVAVPNEAVMTVKSIADYQAALKTNKQNTSLNNQAYLSITQPRNGQRIARGTRVKIRAEGRPKNHVRNVVFQVNGKRIGFDGSSPFSTSWYAGRSGQFVITAKGIQRGGTSVATAVSVTVD